MKSCSNYITRSYILFILTLLFTNFISAQELVWKHTGGPMGGIIGDIAINSKGEIFAGAYFYYERGLFKSSDNGNTWNKINTQFPDFAVYAIYITPNDDIWVGTNSNEIYLSTDNGETWKTKSNGYISSECWAIVENKHGVLFAANGNMGHVYKSTDYGKNWKISAYLYPMVLTADSNNVVYAGTTSGLYSTTDDGLTWVQDEFLKDIPVSSILIDSNNNIFCGTGYYTLDPGIGVLYSENFGKSWSHLGLEGKTVWSLALDSSGSLFAGTLYNGLFKTSDMGKTWNHFQNGLYKQPVNRIKINQRDDIFISSESGGGGVLRSTNGGSLFEQVGLPLSHSKNFVFSGDSLIFAATPSGVQKFNRHMRKWKNSGLYYVNAVAITKSNILYAAADDSGLFRSTDLGDTWLPVKNNNNTFYAYNVLAVNEDTLFVLSNSLMRSTNGGENWTALPVSSLWNGPLLFNNNKLWVVDYFFNIYVLLKSDNYGLTFNSSYSGFWLDNKNQIYATKDGHIFLASGSQPIKGVVRSINNGLNWEQVLFAENLSSAVFANDEGLVITGIFTPEVNKIFMSSNFGNAWDSISLPTTLNIAVTGIKEDPMKNLFFSTNSGLYEVDLVTGIENDLKTVYNFSLSQNYPNPFNPVTVINYSIPVDENVTVKVYDILGREIAILVNGYNKAGTHSVNFDAAKLASGIYFYSFKAGNFSQTKKMILAK